MKILMGNNTLSLLAGSETWTETMAKQFKKMGHQVTAYSPDLGLIATKLEMNDIKCIDTLENGNKPKIFDFQMKEELDGYDIAICNHNQITKDIKEAYPELPIIATVHGIIQSNKETGEIYPEHPVTEFKVDQYVSVSEEVQLMIKDLYNIDSEIIRNPVDMERYSRQPFNKEFKKMLVNTNYWGPNDEINKIIMELARKTESQLTAIGCNFSPVYDVEQVLKDVDMVFGMGRGLLEAMAMGKLAVCHGRWGTGGVVSPDTVGDIREFNFSGRNSRGKYLKSDELLAEIKKYYTEDIIEHNYKYILENHSSEVIAQKYLDIANKILNK